MANATATRPSFNIALAAGRKQVLAILDSEENPTEGQESQINQIEDFSSMDDYIREGELPVIVAGDSLIFDGNGGDSLYVVAKGVIYKNASSDSFHDQLRAIMKEPTNLKNPAKHFDCIGFIADREITIGKQTYAKTVLRRGDEEYNDLVSELPDDFPTISLDCMAQMFEDDNTEKSLDAVASKIGNGTITLIDFLPDVRKPLSAADKKAVAKAGKESKPEFMPVGEPGFSVVGNEWHRSSTILIRDKSKGGHSYIFGQDEGTYFGCKLIDHPDDIDGAFTSLMPEEVRGMTCQRQGEWFLLTVSENEVPTISESVAILPEGCALPITDPESHLHNITSNADNGIRIARDGTIFAEDGYVTHDDHAEISFNGWVKFCRNTALKSVSADANVD